MRQKDKPVPFKVVDAIRVLNGVQAAYFAPHPHRPGDIVQSKEFHEVWAGYQSEERTPCLILATCPDLSVMTGDAEHTGLPGVRVASADPVGVRVAWYEPWYFEPWSGPRPDAH